MITEVSSQFGYYPTEEVIQRLVQTNDDCFALMTKEEKAETLRDDPHFKICNQSIFPYPKNAEEAFQIDFQSALKEIHNIIELGLFPKAQQKLGKLLESIEDKDLEKNIAGFQLLSEIYLKEEKYPEAAGILWYAKRLDKEGKSHKKIDAQLDVIERSLLHKATNAKGSVKGIAQSKLDQEKLKELREQIREEYDSIKLIEDNFERAQALRCLYQGTITKELKAYIHGLVQDVISQMADWGLKPPCEYALIGLGSLAREEMTPYSDFEFALLIDSEDESDKEFFRLFTNLLHLRFINLGETILPSLDIHCLDWVFDTITPRGLSFDGKMPTACKTALGKNKNQEGDYELIHSPQKMSEYQFINVKEDEQRLWILKRYHLPSILSTCTYVSGSEKGVNLVSEYQKEVQTILEKGEGKQRAFDLIKDDLDHFKPHLEEDESGKHYNVKKDLYRFPNTMFDGLANYFCIKATSTWERIEELEEKGILTPSAAQDLKELVMFSQELRLATYLNYDCQKDHLDMDMQSNKLQELYYRVLPFASAMEAFWSEIKNGSPEACLKKERFYENSFFHQGIIAFRHMNYLEAYRCLSLQVVDTLDYYEILGAVENTLAKYEDAEKTYLRAIEKQPSCEFYMKLGNVRQSLSQYKKNKKGDESAEETFFKAKKLAEESCDGLLLERVYRALTIFYKKCGDYAGVREYLLKCKEISESRTSNKVVDSEYGVVLDLELARTKELEGHILNDIDSEFKRSRKLFHSAKRTFKGYYRRKDHPTVAESYNNEGAIFVKLGKYEEALKHQQKALSILSIVFGEEHPAVANAYNNVGGTLLELGKHKEALEYQQKTLSILSRLFGEENPDVAASYNNLGSIQGQLGKHKEALDLKQKSLDMNLTIFKGNHPNVALLYNNVGNTLGYLGRHNAALEQQKKALKMQLAIFEEMHPDVAITYSNMGISFFNLGKYKEALEHQQKALNIRLKIFGKKHPSVANLYNNMGSILLEQSAHIDAMKYLQKALKIWLTIFDEEHPDVINTLNSLGNVFAKLGKYDEALKHQKEALKIRLKIFGEKHPLVATSYNNVGSTFGELGKHEKALKYKLKALNTFVAIFGDVHPDVATSYNNVGNTLGELGRHKEALVYEQDALKMFIAVFGEKHPLVATSYNNVGTTLTELDDYKEGLEHQQRALEMRLEIFGRKHVDVATSYNNVARASFMLNDYFSAISCLKKALDIYQYQPGYQLHPKIVEIHQGLANSYLRQNNKEKSIEHLKESQKLSREIDNQKTFQKNEDLLKGLLLKKKYQEAYQVFIKLPKYLKEATEFLCLQMQTAFLCSELNKKTLEKYINNAETALNKDEGSIPTQMKLCINLAAYWLKANKWEKVNECITHLQKLIDKAPTFCYQYTLLDLLPFGEDPSIEGECIPAEILCDYILLKVYQKKKNHQNFSVLAKQLLQKVDSLETSGHKTEEIKNFCLECLKEQKK